MTETVFLTVALIALLTLAFFAAGYRLGHTEGLLEGERARRETAENMLVTGTPMAPSARLDRPRRTPRPPSPPGSRRRWWTTWRMASSGWRRRRGSR